MSIRFSFRPERLRWSRSGFSGVQPLVLARAVRAVVAAGLPLRDVVRGVSRRQTDSWSTRQGCLQSPGPRGCATQAVWFAGLRDSGFQPAPESPADSLLAPGPACLRRLFDNFALPREPEY